MIYLSNEPVSNIMPASKQNSKSNQLVRWIQTSSFVEGRKAGMKVVRDGAAWGRGRGWSRKAHPAGWGHPRFFPRLHKAVSWLTWGSSL